MGSESPKLARIGSIGGSPLMGRSGTF